MDPIGNNPLVESNQSWNGWGQQPSGPPPFAGGAPGFGGDRLSVFGSSPNGFGYGQGSVADEGGDTSGSGVFSQFLGFTQNVFSELGQLMQQLTGQGGSAAGAGEPCQNGQCADGASSPGPQAYFQNASMSSVGDPHDSFSGTGGNGQTVSGKWDNMKSHAHLITSDSIPGGFNVSTTATTPNANGVTYNSQATITTNNGNTVVSMGANGTPSVTDNGQTVSLTAGSPATLSNGETVTLNADGSMTVGVSNGQGGTINTTLKSNGNGVDVSATANDVDLGGYLANKQDGAFANQGPGAVSTPVFGWNPAQGIGDPFEPYPQPYQPYSSSYQPYQSGLQPFGEPELAPADDPYFV
ncbi:MAG TPA: hypothetical protein VME66_15520 [Candidatus Acidoferrales bacterium]|nr:hypothetical protein [Candidatus Acidoferrales bacterium]